ncbi:MAG: GAF domain-containing protein [Candidatus Promineifilaceae bacterium]
MNEVITIDNVEALRQAADYARAASDYEAAVSLYSQALSRDGLPASLAIALRDGRAACFEQLGNIPAQLADLNAAIQLLAQQNAGLFEEVQERNQEISRALEQQTATSEVLRALSGFRPDLRSLLEVIAVNAAKVCGADDAHIYRIEGARLIEWTHRGPIPGLEAGESLPIDRRSVMGRAISDRQTIHMRDAAVELEEREYPVSVSLQRRWGYRTVLVTPLLRDGEPIGGIAIRRQVVQPFTEKQVELLKTFADQAVIAIENVRLFDETQRLLKDTQQRNDELAIINSVQAGLASRLDFDAIIDLVGNKIRDIFDAQSVAIGMYNHAAGLVDYRHVVQEGRRVYMEPAPFAGMSRYMIDRRQALVINDHVAQRVQEIGAIFPSDFVLPRSTLYVPLLVGEMVTGVINIADLDREHAFSESDVRLLQTLANSMSVALENARLFDEVNTRNRQLADALERQMATGQILSVIASSPTDVQPVLEVIAESAARLSGTGDAAIAIVEEGFLRMGAHYGDIATFPRGAGIPLNRESVAGRAILEGRPLQAIHKQSGAESEFPVGDEVARRYGYNMTFAAPLMREGNAIGSIFIRRTEAELLTEQQIELVQTFADQAVIAIENARLYSEAEEARAAAEEANQSKSAFLANVSHELRTPLTSILGFARLVQKRLQERVFPLIPAGDERAQRAASQIGDNLGIILAEGARLTTLINNVLDLEKIEAGRMEWRMEPLSVAEVVTQGLQATAAIIQQAGLGLDQQLLDDLPEVVGDRDKLVQVVINLLSNAIKFTQSGAISCRAALVDSEVQVSVRDTGVGISTDDLPSVFEKFRQVGDTLTEKPKGTGLGLAICKEIVERHGGRIWVESVPGEGSTFTFALPATGAAARVG